MGRAHRVVRTSPTRRSSTGWPPRPTLATSPRAGGLGRRTTTRCSPSCTARSSPGSRCRGRAPAPRVSRLLDGRRRCASMARMATALALDHLVLVVADVERTLAWYGRHAGLTGVRVDEWREGGRRSRRCGSTRRRSSTWCPASTTDGSAGPPRPHLLRRDPRRPRRPGRRPRPQVVDSGRPLRGPGRRRVDLRARPRRPTGRVPHLRGRRGGLTPTSHAAPGRAASGVARAGRMGRCGSDSSWAPAGSPGSLTTPRRSPPWSTTWGGIRAPAEVVTGTSAGSVVGALLRRGIPAGRPGGHRRRPRADGQPGGVVTRALRDRPEFPPLRLRSLVGRPPRLPSPALVGGVAAAAVAGRPGDRAGQRHPRRPARPGRARQRPRRGAGLALAGRRPVDLRGAPAATCAGWCWAATCRPGCPRPWRRRARSPATSARCEIGRRAYIDGGVRSPTNADVLRRARRSTWRSSCRRCRAGSSAGSGRRNVGAAARPGQARPPSAADWTRRASPSVVIEPGPRGDRRSLGCRLHERRPRRGDRGRGALLDTGEQVRAPVVRTLLAGLTDASRREATAPGRTRRARRPERRPGRRPLR